MSTLKFIPALFCLTIWINANSQDSTHEKRLNEYKKMVLREYNYTIDSSNHISYYEKAKSLIEMGNYDSSYKATKILWGLLFYDTLQYSTELFQPLLSKIEKSNQSNFHNAIIGKWRFSHDFNTGLVTSITSSTDQDTLKVMEFTDTGILVYVKNKLIRKAKYYLVSNPSQSDLSRVNNFRITFSDTKKKWGFVLDSKYLTILVDPDCSCGCRQDIYLKQPARKLITLK